MRCENCVTQLQILKDRISRVWKQHPLAEDNVHHDVITPIHHVVSELSAPTATPLPPSGPSLTGLPPELRLLIFGHLLPRNKVLRLVTHGTARPFYEVLAINKQIHAELRPLFYGRNRFVVTRKEFTHSNLCWTLLHMDTPADAPIRYMRSVSICIQTAPPYKSRLPMIADTSFVAIWLELFYLLRTVPLKLALYFAFWPEDLCDIEMDVSESFDTLVEQDFRGPGKAGWAILGEKGKVPQCQDIYGLRLGSTTDDDVGSHAAMDKFFHQTCDRVESAFTDTRTGASRQFSSHCRLITHIVAATSYIGSTRKDELRAVFVGTYRADGRLYEVDLVKRWCPEASWVE